MGSSNGTVFCLLCKQIDCGTMPEMLSRIDYALNTHA
jgi:hypothetical protein